MGKPFPEIQKELRNHLINGIDLAISAIKAILPEGTDKYKDLILLESRYRGVNQQLLQGVLSYDDSQLEFNKIRKALLDFIDNLTEADLKVATPDANAPKDVYNGEVLYRIPRTMQIQQEVKCIVRVAFSKQVLLEGLEQEQEDVVKDIRISDVMGVELLDPSARTFQIRPFCETVQFVEKDLATEWIFYVTPLMEGVHPLVLRISVIEIINGIERKRNVVLEEKVQIITTAPAEEGVESFRPAGIPVNIAQPTVDTAGPVPPPPPPASAPAGRPAPAPPQAAPVPESEPRRAPAPSLGRSFARNLARVAGVLVLIIGMGVVAINYIAGPKNAEIPGSSPTAIKDWEDALGEGSKDTLENFIEKYPESPESEIAKQNLLALETSTFESALASGEAAQLEAYVKTYGEDAIYGSQAAAVLMAMRAPNTRDNFSWTFSRNVLSVKSRIPNLPYLVTVNRDTQIVSRYHQAQGEPLSVSLDSLKSGKYQLFVVPTYQGADPVKGTITIQTKGGTKPRQVNPNKKITPTKDQPVNTGGEGTGTTPEVNPSAVQPDTTTLTPEQPVNPPGENQPVPKVLAARKPIFKGCERSDRKKEETCTEERIRNFVSDGLEYPKEALRKGIVGTITVEFIVEKDGSVSHVRARNDIGGNCAEEAVRLVQTMPKFKPGLNDKGEPIRVIYLLPIVFKRT